MTEGTSLARAANIATIVVAVCVLAVATQLFLQPAASRSRTLNPGPDSVLVPQWQKFLPGGHQIGPDSAPVTILEFGDYECPFCVRLAPRIKAILANFPGRVRFVYRHWPLTNHRLAYPAARAAECAADQDRFWQYHDLLYAMSDSLGLVSFQGIATLAGVPDLARFQLCHSRREPVESIERGIRDAQAAGGTGTPTIIINGVRLRRTIDSSYIANLLSRGQ